jgi:putative 4-mercaptohistidine N1-methyltranferase
MNIYETDKLLAEYLLFHYGAPDEVLPYAFGPREALGYPQRCALECVDVGKLPERARALDLGCAVGRSTFELARFCEEVIGIDYSARFIDAAKTLQAGGVLAYQRVDEGRLGTECRAVAPAGIDRSRVRFETGDAMDLRGDLGSFDAVLMANLIDRLWIPPLCLARLPNLVKRGGQLILTSPYTWLEEFTPQSHWLGGFEQNGKPVTTLDGLKAALEPHFEFVTAKDLPFLIREHARKYQWSVAQATLWRRKSTVAS